ncbi:MAG: phosphate signaling complex protein PhoU [Floccifex porci]|uniref:Phosphate-specific transport system accessory protein PhoU n=1 Tax=Floccifex porci TaxID=2606629 RepID=A0A7X2N258_9FIRM|nr:phosphate signaling complex protein PhoU [Floccifex porci]MCI7803430.1 phosphate signaling complex protein PhoU [Erysipelotrichaceae bacterium]MDD7466491.1 phosphate signaling complex protein PhoU [Floccifex porci]MDO4479741.1 phosphate signaling complex protein PhoU [Erysipelotrichaceae bacterium]MDY4796823.1 phosphate signaling complex protein PhoU [Floccifex porci]MSS01105.1 phosphate signaling complex protein PhoU [Floccifex porci]
MRSKFDEQLKQLHIDLLDMAYLIQDAIQNAMIYFFEADINGAKKIIKNDENVNHYQKKIENICFNLLIQQQPVAKDLRTITAALKMVTDMERIGDHASDISELVIDMKDCPILFNVDRFKEMYSNVVSMLIQSINAYVNKDIQMAKECIKEDDEIDLLFDKNKEDLIQLIHENPEKGRAAVDLLMVNKYLERIGDHVTNIAEWVIYSLDNNPVNEQ